MDHHTLAAFSIAGVSLDLLGSLYLAYDLLGGQHGPLRLLTRIVTYSVVFGIGYGLGLGLFFGITAGITQGITIAIELNRASRGQGRFSRWWESLFSAIRGIGFGLGLYRQTGAAFAIAFAVLITLGQLIAYHRGVTPAMDYSANRKPRLTRRQFWGTVMRTLGSIATAMLCSLLVQQIDHPWLLALRVGLMTGIVTGVGTAINPLLEYYADNLPERRLAAFGVGFIFCGFAMQSLQYWVALLDISIR